MAQWPNDSIIHNSRAARSFWHLSSCNSHPPEIKKHRAWGVVQMKSRIAGLTVALLLAGPGAVMPCTVVAAEAQAAPATTSPGAGRSSYAPDPQLRYRDGRTAQAAPAPSSAPNTAAPSPPQEPYLRNSFDRIRNYVPDLASGLLVFAVGVLVAYLIRLVLLRVLPRTGLDSFLQRNGLIVTPPPDLPQLKYGIEADAARRRAIRVAEPYQSYFGRSPARRWRAEESAGYRPPHEPEEEKVFPVDEGSPLEPGGKPRDVYEQRLEGSPLVEHPLVYEKKSESFSEERYSFDSPDTAERASVSGDAQHYFEREEFDPERHHIPVSAEYEGRAPAPPRRRAEDLYRSRVGTRVVAGTVFWIVVIAALMEACRAARLYRFASGLDDVLAYIPHLIAAVLIFIGSILVANWIRERLVGGDASTASLVGGAVKAGILTIGGFMALRELQIAPDIVKIAFTLAFGAIALATALALGLGSRKVAEQMTSEIYDDNASKLKEFSRKFRKGPDKAA